MPRNPPILGDMQQRDEYLRALEDRGGDATVLLIDIDSFKLINDNYSHAFGDTVLATVRQLTAALVGTYVDAKAFIAGGDEICAILTNHNLQEGLALAERIRSDVAARCTNDLSLSVTVTVGVATANAAAVSTALEHADAALREGKRRRNCVVAYDSTAARTDGRRVVINPRLFEALDKTLRLAFVTTGSYHRAGDLVRRCNGAIKCLGIMGPSDLLFVHLGRTDRQFFAEVQPLMIESGADPLVASYPPFFAAIRILKFRSYQVFPNVSAPGSMELRDLAAAAQGMLLFDDSQEREWREDGLILAVEDMTMRPGQIEAYMTFALSLPLDVHGRVTEMLVHKLLYAVVLPDPRVFSVYEGWGSVRTVQFVIRTRSTPT